VQHADGSLLLDDGETRSFDVAALLRPLEVALRALTGTVILLAAALVTARLA
jgi:hypothetical protein